jgi:excisionase family DNA binding protein
MDPTLTLKEMAQMLKVHPMTLYRLANAHGVPAFKVGGHWRFNQELVEKWIKESTQVVDRLDDL